MLRKSTLALSIMLVFAAAVGVTAQEKAKEAVPMALSIKAVSPQAEKGVIAAKDSFSVDLVMDYSGPQDLSGGSFGIQFFSPDKSLKSVTLRPVDTAGGDYANIEYLNGWNDMFSAFNSINLEEQLGYDGKLPDSTYFIFAGIKGLPSRQGPKTMIRFNFKADGSGKLCVDSVGKTSGDLDWLFPANVNVTFGGPYCWELK